MKKCPGIARPFILPVRLKNQVGTAAFSDLKFVPEGKTLVGGVQWAIRPGMIKPTIVSKTEQAVRKQVARQTAVLTKADAAVGPPPVAKAVAKAVAAEEVAKEMAKEAAKEVAKEMAKLPPKA